MQNSRSGNIVEPMLKPQWWVKCKDMAAAAANAVRNGEIEIQPKLSEREWFKWLDNCQDWCVSRQLWWGHQIPAYLVNIDGKPLEVNIYFYIKIKKKNKKKKNNNNKIYVE